MLMNEPIASRSHFSIQFDEEREKFQATTGGPRFHHVSITKRRDLGASSPGDEGFGMLKGVVFGDANPGSRKFCQDLSRIPKTFPSEATSNYHFIKS